MHPSTPPRPDLDTLREWFRYQQSSSPHSLTAYYGMVMIEEIESLRSERDSLNSAYVEHTQNIKSLKSENASLYREVSGLKISHKESKLMNCYVKKRDDDSSEMLFHSAPNGPIVACLDGYAIIPKAEYESLTSPKPQAEAP